MVDDVKRTVTGALAGAVAEASLVEPAAPLPCAATAAGGGGRQRPRPRGRARGAAGGRRRPRGREAMSAPAASPPPAPEGEVQLTFMDHLRDLRKRLARALYGVAIGMLAVGLFVERIFHLLMDPVLASLPEGQRTLQYTSYVEPLMVYLKVALYGGIFLAAPWVLFQLWLFIAPGLYKREKKVVVPSSPSGPPSSTAAPPSATSS